IVLKYNNYINNMKKLFLPCIVIFFSGILVIDILINKGVFVSHDIWSNITYFASFYTSLSEGIIIPRWSANLANLYGSPTSMFFYPASYYFSSVFKFLGFSFTDSIKIFFFLSFVLSAVFMRIFLRLHFGDIAATAGALLYVYAPYRLSNIYARGSLAENTAFMFTPLTLIFIHKLFRDKNIKSVIILAFMFAGLILSHPFIAVVFTHFYISYLFFLKPDFRKIRLLVFAGSLSLFLTFFYILPLLIENKYTHYDISPFNGSGYYKQFLNLKRLTVPSWTFIDDAGKLEYQTYHIGELQLFVLLVAVIVFVVKFIERKKIVGKKDLLAVAIFNLFISIFLMLPQSDFIYKNIIYLQRIEFPWRFLILSTFSIALIFSVSMDIVKNKRIQFILLILVLFFGIIFYLRYSRGHEYRLVRDSYFLFQVRENSDGFSSLPRWAAAPETYSRIEKRYLTSDENAIIETLKITSTLHRYYSHSENAYQFIDATFYFPGWNAYIDGQKQAIEFQNPDYRGIITFPVSKGEHLLEIKFVKTKLRLFADFVSLLTLLSIGGGLIFFHGKKSR